MEVRGVYTITQEIPDLVVVEEEELIIEVGVLVDPVVIVAVLVQMVLTMADGLQDLVHLRLQPLRLHRSS